MCDQRADITEPDQTPSTAETNEQAPIPNEQPPETKDNIQLEDEGSIDSRSVLRGRNGGTYLPKCL